MKNKNMIKKYQHFNESQKLTDEILDKISDQGKESLTKDELSYLNALSKKDYKLIDEIEDRILNKTSFEEDDEDEYNLEKMSPEKLNMFLNDIIDDLNILLAKDVIQDIRHDKDAVDNFLKEILLSLANARQNRIKDSLNHLTNAIQNFHLEESFYQKYKDKTWFKELILYLDDLEQLLNVMS